MQLLLFSNFLVQQALHLYNKVRGQGRVMVKVRCQRKPYFLSSCYKINSKLGVKVAYGLSLTWLILEADQPWPSWFSLPVENCLPLCQILKLYHVVPHMKALDKCFPHQVIFLRYDVIWWRHNVKTYFYPKIECSCFPSKDHHRWHILVSGA
jgi:hypothetical protein